MSLPTIRLRCSCAALLCLMMAVQGRAQGGVSIPELAGKSAKERSRMAEKEARDAQDDAEFHRLMAEAEELFRQGRHAEALAGYEGARDRRPLNVHPRVKIQDISDLIARNEAAARAAAEAGRPAEAPAEPGPAASPVPTPSVPVAVVEEMPPAPSAPNAEASAPRDVAPPPQAPREKQEVRPSKPDRQALALPVETEAGYLEEQFREGNAIVIQRTFPQVPAPEVYRKVMHPWGQTYHFHNGQPIDERGWSDRFGDR